jgi:hypothetical protein
MTIQKLNEYKDAKSIIKSFCVLNNIKLPICKINNDINYLGEYLIKSNKSNSIYINLNKCKKSTKLNTSALIKDKTISGVLIHEFAHYLHYVYFYNLLNKKFKNLKEPLIHYFEIDIEEDIAESIRLFITNPTLLKEGRPKRYKILNDLFKPILYTHYSGLIHSKQNKYLINWINCIV